MYYELEIPAWKEGRIIHTLLILGAEDSPTEEEIETYRKDLRLLEFEQNKLCYKAE